MGIFLKMRLDLKRKPRYGQIPSICLRISYRGGNAWEIID